MSAPAIVEAMSAPPTLAELERLRRSWLYCAELFLKRGRVEAARDAISNAKRVKRIILRTRT